MEAQAILLGRVAHQHADALHLGRQGRQLVGASPQESRLQQVFGRIAAHTERRLFAAHPTPRPYSARQFSRHVSKKPTKPPAPSPPAARWLPRARASSPATSLPRASKPKRVDEKLRITHAPQRLRRHRLQQHVDRHIDGGDAEAQPRHRHPAPGHPAGQRKTATDTALMALPTTTVPARRRPRWWARNTVPRRRRSRPRPRSAREGAMSPPKMSRANTGSSTA